MTAKISSTATRVSGSVSGVGSLRVLRGVCATGKEDLLPAESVGRLGDCRDGAVLVDVLVVGVPLSVRDCDESSK